jgi:hypothetical protein
MTPPAWRWLTEEAVLAIHDEQIAEHGGAPGLRDLALLQSALSRPQNLAASETADAATSPPPTFSASPPTARSLTATNAPPSSPPTFSSSTTVTT